MAAYNKHQIFLKNVMEKVHNLASDTLKCMLTNTAPTAANAIFSDLTEITAGNGYTAGGGTAALGSSTQTSGVYKLILSDVVITATGAIGPFRYVDLYNSTPVSPLKPLISWWDYGSSISLANGESFTTHFDATNGVLQDA